MLLDNLLTDPVPELLSISPITPLVGGLVQRPLSFGMHDVQRQWRGSTRRRWLWADSSMSHTKRCETPTL